jgi:hypothetical protein
MGVVGEIPIGHAEHNGELSAQRIISIFEFALTRDWDHLLLLEYDAIALSLPPDVMPDKGGVSAARYKQNKPYKFRGKFYLHYPMLFTREAVEKLIKFLPNIVSNDRYFSDRFIGRAVELANIPVKNLIKTGRAYTKNTIEDRHIPNLIKAAKGGALFYHGIKSERVLNAILNNQK